MNAPAEVPRYTLDEARRVLAALECRAQGHAFMVTARTADGWPAPEPPIFPTDPADPTAVWCSRGCGAGPWKVAPTVLEHRVQWSLTTDDHRLLGVCVNEGCGWSHELDSQRQTETSLTSTGIPPCRGRRASAEGGQ